MADYKSAYTGAEIDAGIAKAQTALQSVPNATQAAAGLMAAADKKKLDGVATGANNYTLPAATASTLGGVKVGAGLSVDSDGTLAATGGGTADSVAWGSVTGKPDAYPPETHSHEQSEINGLSSALADKAPSSHTHAYADITDKPDAFPPESHSHAYSTITGKPSTFPPATHSHEQSDVAGLTDALAGKASAEHSHAYSEITGAPTFSYDESTQTLSITIT